MLMRDALGTIFTDGDFAEQINPVVERYQEYIAEGGEPLSPPIWLFEKPVNKINPRSDKPVNNLNSPPKPFPNAEELLNKLRGQNQKSKATYLDVKILLAFLTPSTESPQAED
ncbi:hypothetical protein [Microcoleus sp.]|uniref:hypothetical protein n=1 Tax=Microcoleus sp. TaxID=44472 RepID=UPI0035263E86